jgi:hypothetical protein
MPKHKDTFFLFGFYDWSLMRNSSITSNLSHTEQEKQTVSTVSNTFHYTGLHT